MFKSMITGLIMGSVGIAHAENFSTETWQLSENQKYYHIKEKNYDKVYGLLGYNNENRIDLVFIIFDGRVCEYTKGQSIEGVPLEMNGKPIKVNVMCQPDQQHMQVFLHPDSASRVFNEFKAKRKVVVTDIDINLEAEFSAMGFNAALRALQSN